MDWLTEASSSVHLETDRSGHFRSLDSTTLPSFAFLDTDDDGHYGLGREPSAACVRDAEASGSAAKCTLAATKLALSHQWTFRGNVEGSQNDLKLTGDWQETLEFNGEFFDSGGRPLAGAQICWREKQVCASSDGRSARISVPLCGAAPADRQDLSVEVRGELQTVALDPTLLSEPHIDIDSSDASIVISLAFTIRPTHVVAEVQNGGAATWTSMRTNGKGHVSLSGSGALAIIPRSELMPGSIIVVNAVTLGPIESVGSLGGEKIISRSIGEVRTSLHWSAP